jgi:tRNA A37 methylthiotransferase MiaB
LLETFRYDQVFAAAYSERPGTPATHLADDVLADVKRRRLNELLALQEPIGLERNRAWLGREVEVLVDTIVRPRSHEHDDGHDERDAAGGGERGDARVAAATPGPGEVRLSGRTRQNKLVHLIGPASWIGRLVRVQVEHAGPYALRGTARAKDARSGKDSRALRATESSAVPA